jgi:hypothetical protein
MRAPFFRRARLAAGTPWLRAAMAAFLAVQSGWVQFHLLTSHDDPAAARIASAQAGDRDHRSHSGFDRSEEATPHHSADHHSASHRHSHGSASHDDPHDTAHSDPHLPSDHQSVAKTLTAPATVTFIASITSALPEPVQIAWVASSQTRWRIPEDPPPRALASRAPPLT